MAAILMFVVQIVDATAINVGQIFVQIWGVVINALATPMVVE